MQFFSPNLSNLRTTMDSRNANSSLFLSLTFKFRNASESDILDAIHFGSGNSLHALTILKGSFADTIKEMFTAEQDKMMFNTDEILVEQLITMKGGALCLERSKYLKSE